MNDLISVIIPVYNVRKYLPHCLKSVIRQSYKNLEIILVDDGSKDGSAEICDKSARKDARIKVIHKENAGVSEARNDGIRVATGKWINFVDADDWLPKNSIELLYDAAEKNNVDLSVGNICFVYNGKKGIWKNYDNKIFNTINKDIEYFINNCPLGPVGKLYKRQIILDSSVNFDKLIKINEDIIFNYNYLEGCDTAIIINQNTYFYNRITHKSAIVKGYENFFEFKTALIDAKFSLDKKIGKSLLEEADYVLEIYKHVCNHYVNHFDKEKALNLISQTKNAFTKYVCEVKSEENVKSDLWAFWELTAEDTIKFCLGREKRQNKLKQKLNIFLGKIKEFFIFGL